MACMCGDYCCSSCGPAQGNWKCPLCREWASEGCTHVYYNFRKKRMMLKAKFKQKAEEIARIEAEADLQYDPNGEDF